MSHSGVLHFGVCSAAALAGGFSCGCLVVPVPHGEIVSDRYTVPANVAASQPMTSSRADIALQLGAPEYRFEDDAIWAYHWTSSRMGLFAVSYFPPIPPVYVNKEGTEHFVVFRFNASGQLLSVVRLAGEYRWSGTPDWRASLDAWLHPQQYPKLDEKNRPELKPEVPPTPSTSASTSRNPT